MPTVTLSLLPGEYAICRLAPGDADPSWARESGVSAVVRTAEELSVLCSAEKIPAGVKREGGWRLFKFRGPFAFTQTGILASVLNPLADARIGILAVSTFDTDYVLVKHNDLDRARELLVASGHEVLWP